MANLKERLIRFWPAMALIGTLAIGYLGYRDLTQRNEGLQAAVTRIAQTAAAPPPLTLTPIVISTATVNRQSTPTQRTTVENQKAALAKLTITGVPQTVARSALNSANEITPKPGDVRHNNNIGLNTQSFLAEPGVRTVLNLKEVDESALLITPDTQKNFDQPGPSYWGVVEDGFVMFTGARMSLEFNGSTGHTTVKLGAQEGHSWLVIVKGLPGDGKPDTDNNLPIKIGDYDPSFLLGTRLPVGQFVSEDYFNQNVATTHTENCGRSGCTLVSALFIDAGIGAYTAITQNGSNTPWQLVATNIK